MGIIKKGANGAFSGKAGSVVGSSWRNIDYIKGLPKKRTKEPTQRQLEQQMRFSMAGRFLRPLRKMLVLSFSSSKTGRATATNLAQQHLLAHAIVGEYPDLEIDYSAVRIAQGGWGESAGTISAEEGGLLKLIWDPTVNKFNAFADDEIVVVLYNAERSMFMNGPNGKTRADAELEISVRPEVLGQKIYAYFYFTSRDGQEVSNSSFAGEVIPI